jgi:hypothetical protein
MLPRVNRAVLEMVVRLLACVGARADVNSMSTENLAIWYAF